MVALLLVGAGRLAAQEAQGDSAWSRGRYDEARAAYERVLAKDPNAAVANLRIGVMLSWRGRLDSAMTYIARARAADPSDVETRLVQARVLSWKKRYDAALALYDSVLADHPDVRDALFGKAQVSAWRGLLAAAEEEYRAILARDPRDADALVGLGYVYHWQGKETAAAREARAALVVDPTHQGARTLRRTIEETTRPSLEITAGWNNDSDRNTNLRQAIAAFGLVADRIGVVGSVNALEASDPALDAAGLGGEAGLTLTLGRFQLMGAGGAQRLMPQLAPDRTVATYRGRVGYHPVSELGVSLSYSRAPFDEIASLIEQNLSLELLEAGFDARPFTGFTLYGGGNGLWLSDGNRRTGALAGLTQKVLPHFSVGLSGRTLSYTNQRPQYFSPDRFSMLEGTAGYDVEDRHWIGVMNGGFGAQKVGERGSAQSEWHLEGRLGQKWGVGNRVELFGLITNSAVSSTTGAFRYRAAGLTVRLGL